MGVKARTTPLLLGLAFLLLIPRATAQVAIAVVVNPGNPITNISRGDLRKIFAGEKRVWPHGEPIKLIGRGPGCIERVVLLRFLAMSESDYKHYWAAQVFRGDADAEPLTVPSVGMQKEAMALFPGAISLVDAKDVKPGMKLIQVDGLLPGAPGYPLH
ncbi:MAG: substrate-binding domain-containing protein [Candidatus Sulfotelmatobacter sp.]